MRGLPVLSALLLVLRAGPLAAQLDTAPPEALRAADLRRIALTGGRIVTEPGRSLEGGTILIEGGRIAAVLRGRQVPKGYAERSLDGLTVYPAFLDLAASYGLPPAARAGAFAPLPVPPPLEQQAERAGARHWSRRVRPEFSLARHFRPDPERARGLRAAGFAAVLGLPEAGIFRGSGALISLAEGLRPRALLRAADAVQAVGFEFAAFGSGEYPNSLMGAIALVRQTLLDADWHRRLRERGGVAGEGERLAANAALEALAPALERRQPVLFALRDELDYGRAAAIAAEFGLEAWYLGSGHEYRLLPRLARERPRLILPLSFPPPPPVDRPEQEHRVGLAELEHWEQAPANPGRLAAAGVPIALTARGLEDPAREFWPALRRAVAAGLAPEQALRALTLTPAAWLGLGDRLGRIAPGAEASLVIADGDLFADQEARVLELWIEGRRHPLALEPDPRGRWRVELPGAAPASLEIAGSPERPEIAGEPPRPLERDGDRFRATLPATRLGLGEGSVAIGFAVIGARLEGELLVDGRRLPLVATREAAATRSPKPVEPRPPPPWTRYPAGEYGRDGPPPAPRALLLRGATLWTMDERLGVIEGGEMLIEEGRIVAVGRNLRVPRGTERLELPGRHLTPGLIDAHSHTAVAGGLNEASHDTTSEVRVADVLDPTDVNLYRQLAGGVTTALVLHGSANPIGGQSATIKLRWGEGADGLLFADAPPGIKLALGENVKQSNWGDAFRSRYPQTRMGVEQLLLDRFAAAREYAEARRRWRPGEAPLRRDLRLEALAEVLEGRRRVHVHSYVQSEIRMFARLSERLGFRVATFQHVLEGYKVAEELHRIGAGASSFADWWGYKMEVYDAIPHNAAMLVRAGVLTSINSDSNEHARRLNTEAAKAVRHGGLGETEALALVTRNPAEQLGVGHRVGRLAPGYDADFVVWSGHPLSTLSVAEQTWIEGRRYFDRAADRALRERDAAARARLLGLALAAIARGEGRREGRAEERAGGPGTPRSRRPEARPRLLPDLAVHLAALRGLYHEGWDLDSCSLQEHRHRSVGP